MPDLMSFAELAEQDVELLPARTVLSLWHADLGGGDAGMQGNHGADGPGFPGASWLFLFGHGPSGLSVGDASGKNG